MKKAIYYSLILSILSVSAWISCKKDDIGPSPVSSDLKYFTVGGIVVDINNQPLSNVNVTLYGKTVTTNTNGGFFFENNIVPEKRFVITCEKNGYFKAVRSEIPDQSKGSVISVTMIQQNVSNDYGSTSFNSTTGGQLVISSNGSRIIFPNGGYINEDGTSYTGLVYAKAYYLNPTAAQFQNIEYGGDNFAVDSNHTAVILNNFTGLIIEVTDAGGYKINLDPAGTFKATLEMDIPVSLMAYAPATIDFWDFDEGEGLCYSRGKSNKNGDKYIAEVEHFSQWICAKAVKGKAYVSGEVKDLNGKPIPGVRIKIGQTYAITNESGRYSRAVPPDTSAITVSIDPNYYGTFINPITVGPLSSGEKGIANFSVPVLKYVVGKLVNCQGLNTAGGVMLQWMGGFSSVFTRNGEFSLPVVSGYDPILYANGNNETESINITMTFVNEYDAGEIRLCPPVVTGSNEITIDGTTYKDLSGNGRLYSVMDTTSPDSIRKYTSIDLFSGTASVYMTINNATEPGNYYIGGKSPHGSSISVMIGESSYSYTFTSGSINISRYDDVDGLIEGTYSGIGSIGGRSDKSQVPITGTFSVIRFPDQIMP